MKYVYEKKHKDTRKDKLGKNWLKKREKTEKNKISCFKN